MGQPPMGQPPMAQPLMGHPGQAPPGPPPPVPVQQQGGALGHINPAVHNLNYPGMRDRSAVPLLHQGGNHAKPHGVQQQQQTPQHQHHQQQQQAQQQQQLLKQQQQFRQSPQLAQQSRNNNNNVGKPSPHDIAEMNRFHELQQQRQQPPQHE